MEYTNIGPLKVSRITLGTWSFGGGDIWGDRSSKDSARIMHAAMERGVNIFDTAEAYEDGRSEEVIGEAIADRRDKVLLASKFLPQRVKKPADVRTMVEATLKRLKTDYLDLYQQHWPFVDVPFTQSEVEAELSKLQQEGKIRHIGVCNFGVGDLAKAGIPLISNQIGYSLIFRAIEYAILPHMRKIDMGVFTYSALLQGMLSGKYANADEFPAGRRRTRHFSSANEVTRHGEPGHEDETFAAIRACATLADEAGLTLPHCAISWVLAQEGVGSVIVGAGNLEQLEENLSFVESPVSGELVAALSKATEPLKEAMGPNPDLWQGSGKSRVS